MLCLSNCVFNELLDKLAAFPDWQKFKQMGMKSVSCDTSMFAMHTTLDQVSCQLAQHIFNYLASSYSRMSVLTDTGTMNSSSHLPKTLLQSKQLLACFFPTIFRHNYTSHSHSLKPVRTMVHLTHVFIGQVSSGATDTQDCI